LYANKTRGNTEQVAHGLKRSDLSPANLIALLAKRNQPLKKYLFKQLTLKKRSTKNVILDDSHFLQVAALQNQLKSVWVYIQRDKSQISALTQQYYARGEDGKTSAILSLIRETNTANADISVSEDIYLSDFRDAYISFAYKYSGYSWLETQLAAGHKSVKSLRTYLRKRQWKTHGEQRVGEVIENLWNEIRSRRVVDPAILRAMADRGEISDEQRKRWMQHKDRTRVGMGCKDIKHPPKDISPEHPPGRSCIIHRCNLCSHGVIFEDSLDHQTRRFAELEQLKRDIPLNSWYQSSFPVELDAIEYALTLFEQKLVSDRRTFWKTEIDAGRHRPLNMEGSYGTKS
jgi:hypothetical protein